MWAFSFTDPALQESSLFPCFILRNKTKNPLVSLRELFCHADFEANQNVQTCSNLMLFGRLAIAVPANI